MAKEVVYTTSAPLRAFVTLILTVASGKPAAWQGEDQALTRVNRERWIAAGSWKS